MLGVTYHFNESFAFWKKEEGCYKGNKCEYLHTVETKETDTQPICRKDQIEKEVENKEVKVPTESLKEEDPKESETISKKNTINCILARNNHSEED